MSDPRLKILYLLAIAVTAYATASPLLLAGLLAAQVVLGSYARLPLRGLLTILRRLAVFFLVMLFCFVFFGSEEGDRVIRVAVMTWSLPFNLSGALRGLLLSSRILIVLSASRLIQETGDRKAFVDGLRGLFVPDFLAYSLDLVLSSLASERTRGGRGARMQPTLVIRRAVRGDVDALVALLEQSMARARERALLLGLKLEVMRDVSVISGLAAIGMMLRSFKLMPGLPVAPGHKGIILIPLYIVAHDLTASRWGATQMGAVVGVSSFLMGEGKFGPFEVLRHLTPGLFVDLSMPLARRLVRTPGVILYALLGVGVAVTRLSTLVLVGLFVQAPRAFYALLLPMTLANVGFGFLSGFVTFHLLKSVGRLKDALATRED